MLKQSLWAVIAVFILWSLLDFLIHGVLLDDTYRQTAHLWRPEEEMKMTLMWLVTLIFSACFVLIYSCLIRPKSLKSGVTYGLVFGLAMGTTMGIGTYCYLPVPFSLALSWFSGNLVELTLAGAMVGYMVQEQPA